METKSTRRHTRLVIILSVIVIFMFCLSYLMVPLYRLICQKEGINNKSGTVPFDRPKNTHVDYNRTIKIDFFTMVHPGLKFKFIPMEDTIQVHPGELNQVNFYAENQGGKEITVQAIPSITPAEVGAYLRKTECFCFTQQFFRNGQKMQMPVYFFIDPAIPQGISEMTLSYTLFDATPYKKYR